MEPRSGGRRRRLLDDGRVIALLIVVVVLVAFLLGFFVITALGPGEDPNTFSISSVSHLTQRGA